MKVTVGIPVYNCERWIRGAIESALAQTWPDKEVIVVDDGSTDATAGICSEFKGRIHLIRQSKSGGNVARNQILSNAQGDWIQYLDADDYLYPDKITNQVESCRDLDRCDVLCSATVKEYWEGDACVRREAMPLSPDADPIAVYLNWQMPQTGGCLWRKEKLAALGGWDEERRSLQDSELHLRAFKAGLRYRISGTPSSVWRMWSQQTVSNLDKRSMLLGITDLIRDLVSWLDQQGRLTPEYRRRAAKLCFQMARDLANCDLLVAKQYYRERKKEGLVYLENDPRTPWKYRVILHCFGFEAAERVAKLLRPARVAH